MQNDRTNQDLENLKRNLAEQSKWLNDPDPRPWATHPMQTVAGMMQWQVECLTKGN